MFDYQWVFQDWIIEILGGCWCVFWVVDAIFAVDDDGWCLSLEKRHSSIIVPGWHMVAKWGWPKLDGWGDGKFHENRWFESTPILGNLHIHIPVNDVFPQGPRLSSRPTMIIDWQWSLTFSLCQHDTSSKVPISQASHLNMTLLKSVERVNLPPASTRDIHGFHER